MGVLAANVANRASYGGDCRREIADGNSFGRTRYFGGREAATLELRPSIVICDGVRSQAAS
jgi:hypothetical protein